MYAAGEFDEADGGTVNNIARWDGQQWLPLGSGIYGELRSFAVYDDGLGSALYVGGWIYEAGSTPVKNIALWDGADWHALGSGLNGITFAVTTFDDGTGEALFAAGEFWLAGGVAVSEIAKWDGQSWSALGAGTNRRTRAMAVFDDGSGSALYVGGNFTRAGGQTANYVAKWDGASWSPVGAGLDGEVFALAVFDDGTGLALFAGGENIVDGAQASHVAKWDGAMWSPLTGGPNGRVETLAAMQGGSTPMLVAGGKFTDAGAPRTSYVAGWANGSWGRLGSGFDDWVRVVIPASDSTGAETARLTMEPSFHFDYSTLVTDAMHYEVPELPRPITVYKGSFENPDSQLYLPALGSLRLGTIDVALPEEDGAYVLDAANAEAEGSTASAHVLFGFDTVTEWRANGGELVGGTYTFCIGASAAAPMAQPMACLDNADRCGTATCNAESICVCTVDVDCPYQSTCIDGACHAPKHRYLSLVPNPENAGVATARRVGLADETFLGWVDEPYVNGGIVVAELVPDPVYREWTEDAIQVTGCEIATNQVYRVQAIAWGCDASVEEHYSAPLLLHTPTVWGDVVSTCFGNICLPPDGAGGIDDILACQAKFNGIDNAPLSWLDIDPSTGVNMPNQQVNIGDILATMEGFQGQPYPGDGPLGCE